MKFKNNLGEVQDTAEILASDNILTTEEALALLPWTSMREFHILCLKMGKEWTLAYAPGVAVEFGVATEAELAKAHPL